jgi:iron complex outermembrane receptor protein
LTATAQDAAVAGAEESAGIVGSEIIVTARKREERLQDVPAAITAITSDTLLKTATTSYSQVVDMVPSLSIQRADGPAGAIVNLRGIGASTASPSIDGAVSINIDGLQSSQGIFLGLGIYDLDRVEVLKGPQALFYGKNSPGGVISLVSANPGSSFETRVRTGYEIFHKQRFAEAVISGPLSKNFGVRVVGYISDQDGWFRNLSPNAQSRTAPNNTEYFARGTFVYENDSGLFNANLKLSTGKTTGYGNVTAEQQVYACAVPGSLSDCKLDRNDQEADPTPDMLATSEKFAKSPINNQNQSVANLTLNYRPVDSLSLVSVSGYYKARMTRSGNFTAGIGTPNLYALSDISVEQFSQEFRAVTSFDGPINFSGGAYYQHHELGFESAIVGGPTLFPSTVLLEDPAARQKTNAYSTFGQVIYELSSRLEVTAGARYSKEIKRQSYRQRPSASTGYQALVVTPLIDRVSFDDVSAEATVSYKPTRRLTLYAAYREGFTSGGFSLSNFLSTGADNTYRPMNARGGEVGAKGTALDGQLRFDLNAYLFRFKDLQLSTFNPTTLTNRIENAGEAETKGVELTLQLSPRAIDGLTVFGNGNYNRGTFISFENAGCYGGQTIALGCNKAPGRNGAFNAQDLSGAPLLKAPLWTASVGANYDVDVSDDHRIGLGFSANYKSSYFVSNEQDPRSRTPKVLRLDTRISFGSTDGRWEFAVIGKNLTNQLRLSSGGAVGYTGSGTGTNAGVLTDQAGIPTEPRTVLFQATFKP